MRDDLHGPVSRRTAEAGFALFALAIGVVVLFGAGELDTGWSDGALQAGYFPFRIGLLIVIFSLANLYTVARRITGKTEQFISRAQINRLASFALPLVGFLLLTIGVGIYVASPVYVLVAVGWIGKLPVRHTCAAVLIIPTALYVIFELIFKTPLPKGTLGPLLGLS